MSKIHLEDLGGIDLLLAAIRLNSISAAAREARISQPAATQRLRTLERHLGIRLLDRTTSGTYPTAAGQEVARLASRVVDAVAEFDAGLEPLRDRSARRAIRIAASLTVAECLVPRWLEHLRAAGDRPVELIVVNSDAVVRAVVGADADLGFVETPRRLTGVRSIEVGGDRLVVVVGRSHPWTRRRQPLRAEQLAATTLLLREEGSGTRDALEAALASAGLRLAPPLETHASTVTLKSACASGAGACVLSELAVSAELQNGVLHEVPVEGLDLRRIFRAIWRQGSNDAELRQLLRLIQVLE